MTSKRIVVLMAILVALVLGYTAWMMDRAGLFGHDAPPQQAALPGANTITNPRLVREPDGRWIAEFDYHYTGLPKGATAAVTTALTSDPKDGGRIGSWTAIQATPGQQHARLQVPYPNTLVGPVSTEHVVFSLSAGITESVRVSVPQHIDWPDPAAWALEEKARTESPAQLLKSAIAMIDSRDRFQLEQARTLLERLLVRDPKVDQAYLELARIAMSTRGAPEGFHQAEVLIDSALKIRPDSANARILLGYVFTHQSRYKEAEALFASVPLPVENLWLWANWGELLDRQGRRAAAVEKYRLAVAHPPTRDTYDRARQDAFRNLVRMARDRRDLADLDALLRQRLADYPDSTCARIDYARFLLEDMGDGARATEVARSATGNDCNAEDAKYVLAAASYLAWTTATGAERTDRLNQARIYAPPTAELLYRLARHERTLPAVRQLAAAGERIDQADNRQLTALAYAMHERDHAAAARLLRLGARPTAAVDSMGIPVALIPVMTGDFEGIRLMQKSGVDYATMRFNGVTAIEWARRNGDRRLLEALSPKSQSS